jgi:predicted AAA+ superfamily ATPase
MNGKHLKRITDKVLEDALEASGAVLIEGPKWCGKTQILFIIILLTSVK